MSHQVCLKHGQVTAWGCPICRRQALEQGTKEAVEAAKKAIREAYDRHRTASGDGQ